MVDQPPKHSADTDAAPKRTRGRPRHEPTYVIRQQVRQFVLAGVEQGMIAKFLRISLPTLRRHYREELWNTKRNAVAHLHAAVLKEALAGDAKAQMYWLRNKAGWKKPKPGERNPLPVKIEFEEEKKAKTKKKTRPKKIDG